jgi:hypothetical protein
MITNTGKNILAKYLVGQTPAYASYIAVGCGPKPLSKLEFSVTSKALAINGNAKVTVADSEIEPGMTIDVVNVDDALDGTHLVTDVVTNPTGGKDVRFRIPGYSGSGIETTSVSSQLAKVYPNFRSKTTLDFEMFRVPIISRGYITEEAQTLDEFGNPEKISKVVLTAELPSTDRYEISEIGLFSAKSNPLAANTDSRILYSFASNEGWQYHDAKTDTVSAISTINGRLDGIAKDNKIKSDVTGGKQVFQATGSNDIFLDVDRMKRFEQPRFLDNTIFISGLDSKIDTLPASGKLSVISEWEDSSPIGVSNVQLTNGIATVTTSSAHGRSVGDIVKITGVDVQGETFNGTYVIKAVPTSTTFTYDRVGIPNVSSTPTTSGSFVFARRSSHIHLTNTKTPFEKNSPIDELRLAFSIVNADGVPNQGLVKKPESVKVIVEFTSNDAYGQGQVASMEVDIYDTEAVADQTVTLPQNLSNVIQADLSQNRYFVISEQLQDLTKTSGFTWDAVKNAKVYATAIYNGKPSDEFYVCLDGLRFENVSNQNPVYGLTGYSLVVNNVDGYASTIIKAPNTSNYIEFRFAVDI